MKGFFKAVLAVGLFLVPIALASRQKYLPCSKADAADAIDAFIDGTCGPYDWDDFLHHALDNRALPEVRQAARQCLDVERDYPPQRKYNETGWCSEEGIEKMRDISRQLRS